MKHINVLYIGNNLFNKTGYPTTLQTLSNLLANEGYKVVKTSSKLNRVARMLDMVYSILKHQKTTNVVLIDTYSTLNFYYAYSCAILLKYLKIPYIPILHGGNLPNRLIGSPRLSKSIFANAYINVAPSMYLFQVFQNAGFRTVCIPNTLKIDKYRFKERKTLSPKLLYVRSFATIYNPEMAVNALFQLKKHYPNARLCMVGPDRDGSLIRVKDLVKKLNLQDSVEFTGVLTQAAWHKKSEQFDIFINTSHVDNMPVSIIEAMALGLPVVTTNVGGIGFLVKHEENGLLVPDNDYKTMAITIKQLIENGAGNMPQKAREQVEAFRWDAVKHKWNQLLTKV